VEAIVTQEIPHIRARQVRGDGCEQLAVAEKADLHRVIQTACIGCPPADEITPGMVQKALVIWGRGSSPILTKTSAWEKD
jgi:hypothetical protein